MAGQQGPCPTCQREIVAPDPYRGIGGFEAPLPLPTVQPEPYRPFSDSPPLVPKASEPIWPQRAETAAPGSAFIPPATVWPEPPSPSAPETAPTKEIPSSPSAPVTEPTGPQQVAGAKPQRTILILSCLLTGLGGYCLGVRTGTTEFPPVSKESSAPSPSLVAKPETSPLAQPAATTPSPEPAQIPSPEPTLEIPKLEESPEPEIKAPEPAKVSSAAEAALKAFLDAPDWASRAVHVLFPEQVRGTMEAYSRDTPDGPTAYKSISVKQSQIEEKTGHTLFIFMVATEQFPGGIPVAVKETPGGWLVDWQPFVEFRDGWFRKFVDETTDKTGRFHLIVSSPPPRRAADTENEAFSSFLLQSPMENESHLAFVSKKSAIFGEIQSATKDGKIFTPVLDVQKRKTRDGKVYLEILSMKATDWFPREN